MKFEYYGNSDIGPNRKINQDNFGEATTKWGSLFVVSDGFGHEKGGLFASRYTVETLVEVYSHTEPKDVEEFFTNTYKQINKYIYFTKVSKYGRAMMGCTSVALAIYDNMVHVAHIGDSRAYLFRNGEFIQLTKDHSYIQNLIDEGGVTLEEAKLHPKRHVLSRALGSKKQTIPDHRSVEIQPDDKFVLCSDGVWGFIEKESFKKMIGENEPEKAVNSVIKNIKRNNGLDNITLQVIHFE